MTGSKDRKVDSGVEEKQEKGKMASDMSSKYENDGDVENLANNLSVLTIKREPVEDNELPEGLTKLESSSKGENSSPDYEVVHKAEIKQEVDTEDNSALLTRGPTHGHATTTSVQHIGYNKGYGSANAQTFKDKKRGREDDGNDPPLRYLRPEDQLEYSSLTKDKSSLGMMVVKSPNTDVTEMNFPLNQDDIIDLAGAPCYHSNNNGQYNMGSQCHSFNTVFSQAFQPHQTALGQAVNGNVNVINNQQPRPNSIEQQQIYGRHEAYTSESESESAKSPYSDQLYSPDSSSVKSINSPPPSNMSNDSGIIGDLTVNSPLGGGSPLYDMPSSYSQWDDQGHQSPPSQSLPSPPHMSGSQGMSQVGSPRMPQAVSPMMQSAGSPQQIRPHTMVSSHQMVGPVGISPNSGAPLMTSQQLGGPPGISNSASIPSQPRTPLITSQEFVSHPVMVNSVPTTGASMMSNMYGQMTSKPMMMMPSVPSMGQYLPPQTTMSPPQVAHSQLFNEQLDEQIDEKELNFVMEVLVDDIIESNKQNKIKNHQTVPLSAPPPVHQNIPPRHPPLQPVPQNRNFTSGTKLQQNIPLGPNIMTTVPNQNRIPVTIVPNNMIPKQMPVNSTTRNMTPQVVPVSQAQMVLMPPGNQEPVNGLQTAPNVVQPPQMIIILNNPNMNQAPQNKSQPTKILKKILPKPGTIIPDGSKPASASPVTRNLNEAPGGRPVVAKPGQNQQTLYRQNLLNMARRTVADISRDRLRFQDDEGDTYLHVAVCKTDASMVQALIERLWREKLELMIDAPNKKRQTPLYLAVAANQPLMVHSLIARNANPCSMAQVCSNDGKSREVKAPLHVASSNGHSYLPTLQELIKSPAINLNIVNSEGHTALHCAILAHRRQNKNGQFIDSIPVIETLLKAGADPNSQDKKNGKTPLMYAIEKRDTGLVERMLSMFDTGAKLRNIIKSQTFDGSTCIKIAEGLKADFQPDNWQRLLNTLNAALNGDPPRVMNGVM